jgi:iron complex outermembrane recepter protein
MAVAEQPLEHCMNPKPHPLSIAICTALSALASSASHAQSTPTLPTVVVRADKTEAPATSSLATSDTATLLEQTPGLSVSAAGGVSGLPALRGLADDRIKILVDGIDATAACGNHMNPPLSYVDPTQVKAANVIAGISPVSMGGDNIAGVISVQTAKPVFAQPGEGLLKQGQLSTQFRSVDKAMTFGAQASVASETLSLTYTGATTKADSYKDGNGNKVLDTLYKSTNQSLLFAAKNGGDLWTLRLADQQIPYQGFANQYMDMTHNHGLSGNLAYRGKFGWGMLDARVFAQNTEHRMGFFSDERTGTMPMNTNAQDRGYVIKVELPAAAGALRLGTEYHRLRLDDWWPAVSGSMMMGPKAYVNINDGQRDRFGVFGEWEGPVSAGWVASAGLRYESVRTDAGQVQGYGCGMMCAPDNAAASAFNAADRAKTDHNFDITALARHDLSDSLNVEFGFARKTRSPNLYERYSWGRGTMAMTMIGWFGDANGYVGNINLKPEVANTLSTSFKWFDAARDAWHFEVSPYLTYVENYIDVDTVGSFNPYMRMSETKQKLQFANHNARLYGVSLSGDWRALKNAATGDWTLRGKLDWMRGQRVDGGDLYRIMPPNLNLTLENKQGQLTTFAQWMLVAGKRRVDVRRDEYQTPAYALLNLGASYQVNKVLSLQLGVRNVFDRAYALPLGGVNLAEFKTQNTSSLEALQGQGRSFDVGLAVAF